MLERPSRAVTKTSGAHIPAAAEPRLAAVALGERDPDYIGRSLPFTWPLIAAWFRPDIRDLDRIPAGGPVLLVGNHSGGNVAPDTLAFTLGFYRRFGVERPFFQLAHHLVMRAALAVAAGQVRDYRGQLGERTGARSTEQPPSSSTRGVTGRLTDRPGTVAASSSRGVRGSFGSRSRPTCRSYRWSRSAGRRRRCSSRAASVSRERCSSTRASA